MQEATGKSANTEIQAVRIIYQHARSLCVSDSMVAQTKYIASDVHGNANLLMQSISLTPGLLTSASYATFSL